MTSEHRFQRPTTIMDSNAKPGASRWVQLDVLRAVAVFFVLGPHTPFRLPRESLGYWFFEIWRRMGWVGVDLFFVLSGFLIGGLLFSEYRRHGGIRFGRFLLRRTFKIWPSYLVFLTAAFAWDVWDAPDRTVGLLTRCKQSAQGIWPYLIHIQNYFLSPMIERIGHAWSLAVEEHFYLLLPLLLLGLIRWAGRTPEIRANDDSPPAPFRRLPWICLGVMFLCLGLRIHAWRAVSEFDEFSHHWPTHLRMDSLFAGVTLAYAVHFARPRIEALRRWQWTILFSSLGCFIPFGFVSGTSMLACTIGYTVLAMGSMGLVLLAWFSHVPALDFVATETVVATGIPGRMIRGGVAIATVILSKIGERSYSIYLWHTPFAAPFILKLQAHMGFWTSPLHYTLMMATYVTVAIGAGVVMYALIEAPAVMLRERWFPSRSNIEVARAETGVPHLVPRPVIKLPVVESVDRFRHAS